MTKKSGEEEPTEEEPTSQQRSFLTYTDDYVGPWAISTGTKRSLSQISEKVESTGADVGGTIAVINSRVDSLERIVVDSKGKEEIVHLKEATANLSTQFTELKSQTSNLVHVVQENSDFILAVSLAKSIPNLELRIKNLEEDLARKRNWSFNNWSIVIAVLGVVVSVLSCVFGGLITAVLSP